MKNRKYKDSSSGRLHGNLLRRILRDEIDRIKTTYAKSCVKIIKTELINSIFINGRCVQIGIPQSIPFPSNSNLPDPWFQVNINELLLQRIHVLVFKMRFPYVFVFAAVKELLHEYNMSKEFPEWNESPEKMVIFSMLSEPVNDEAKKILIEIFAKGEEHFNPGHVYSIIDLKKSKS